LAQHLQTTVAGRQRWHGHRFDFSGAVFDGGNRAGIDVTSGTVLDLTTATFLGGTVDFTGGKFSGGKVDLAGADFSASTVNFTGAKSSGGGVSERLPDGEPFAAAVPASAF
jgi:hypothetical protein